MQLEPARATPILLGAVAVAVGGSPTAMRQRSVQCGPVQRVDPLKQDGMLGGQTADVSTISPWQFIDEYLDWVAGGVTGEITLKGAELGVCGYL